MNDNEFKNINSELLHTHCPNEMYAFPSLAHISESPKGFDGSRHNAAIRTSGTFPMFPAYKWKKHKLRIRQ